jgi:hypothetical protein
VLTATAREIVVAKKRAGPMLRVPKASKRSASRGSRAAAEKINLSRLHLPATRVLVDQARVSAQGTPVLAPVAGQAGAQWLLAGQGRRHALGDPRVATVRPDDELGTQRPLRAVWVADDNAANGVALAHEALGAAAEHQLHSRRRHGRLAHDRVEPLLDQGNAGTAATQGDRGRAGRQAGA